jgi:uncharacterized Fe-S cluster protein YjdI
MKTDNIKSYTKDELTVIWNPNACIHSENCWRGLIQVFHPKKRPWINLDGAKSEEIIAQINKCPSGALSWKSNLENTPEHTSELRDKTMVEVIQNGPLRIHGGITLQLADGKKETKNNVTALCRCGMSNNKPFCDGTHKKEGWIG